jgi:hypothetical protein
MVANATVWDGPLISARKADIKPRMFVPRAQADGILPAALSG